MIVILANVLGLFLLAAGHWVIGGGLVLLSIAVVFLSPRHWDEL
jgi:hypothetical protein